jgi:N-acetylmuramoyl-L-alanine amidase
MTNLTAARRLLILAALLALTLGGGRPALAGDVSASAAPASATDPVSASAAGALPVMIDARIVGDDARARFVADIDAAVDINVFTLADPYRIVVDLPQIRFDLPETLGQEGRGLVSAFRYGLISPGKSRIVLDVTAPVKIDKSFVIPPTDGQPARIVIDVVPTTREAFLDAARRYRESQAVASSQKEDRALVTPADPASGKLTIVLDPGHGGIDSGAHGAAGTLEKDVTLAFGEVLGDKLEKTGLYNVLYTRTDDSFIALGDRVAYARSHGADLFVSIHSNYFFGGAVRGTTIYTVSDEASDKMAADLAASENQSDVLAGLDMASTDTDQVKDILADLTRRETRNFGVVFARHLVKELGVSTRMFKIPHQTASFKVLEAPDVPSAMIELGYLSNPADEKLLRSQDWRETTADSIVRAIATYFRERVPQKTSP